MWLLPIITAMLLPHRSLADPPVEDDLLILEVRLRGALLLEAIPVVQREDVFFVPLIDLFGCLEFPIRVESDSGRAYGWFLAEDRSFLLDIDAGEVQIRGHTLPFNRNEVLSDGEGIYVSIPLFTDWFPVNLDVDIRNLLLRVASREPLPVEKRLERERIRERALTNRALLDRPAYPMARAPYRVYSWPFFDLTLNGSYNDHTASKYRGSYSNFTTMDLLGLGTQIYVRGDQEEAVSDLLVRAGRKDSEGGLLKPMGATEFTVGDVYSTQSQLVAQSRGGRGVLLSSFPLDRPIEFDRTTIRGEGTPGWEVELYRSGTLLDFQVIGDDGRFEFVDVPVLYGLNLFRSVIYGPQGQRRVENRRLYVGPNLIEPGKGHYRIAASSHANDLLQIGDDCDDEDERKGEARISAEYERGLHRQLSAGISITRIPLSESGGVCQRTYLGSALRGSFSALYGVIDAAFDSDGGWAAQTALQTRWRGINLLGEYGRFVHFRSEQFLNSDLLQHRTRLRLDGGTTFAVPFSFSLASTQGRRESGRVDTEGGGRLSLTLKRVLLSNELNWRGETGGRGAPGDRTWGQALLNSRVRSLVLRGALQYRLHPDRQVQNFTLSASCRNERFGRVTFDVDKALDGGNWVTYTLGWNRTLPLFTFGLGGSWRDDGTVTVGTSVQASLGREPSSGRWNVRSKSMAASGVALARVLLDQNGDGIANAGDRPIPGVRLRVNRSAAAGPPTNDRGETLITGLSAHRVTDITVNEDSFEDPFWIVRPVGMSVLPRPGSTAMMEFLVEETGEIDGTVFLRLGEEVRPVSRVKLELLDGDGKVTNRTESAFDGFYLFEKIPFGQYKLRIVKEQSGRFEVTGPARSLPIDEGNPILSGIDLVLEPIGKLP